MSKRAITFLFFIPLLLATSFTACTGKHDEHGVATQEEQQPSPWKMALSTEPAQPKYGEDTTFRVTMQDEAGKPVAGAKVEADLKMKSHDMGKNIVSLTDNGQGMYEGKGKFSMAGPWDVVVVASKDGKSGAQTFGVVARKE